MFNDEEESQGLSDGEEGCFSMSNWEDGVMEVSVAGKRDMGRFFSGSEDGETDEEVGGLGRMVQ